MTAGNVIIWAFAAMVAALAVFVVCAVASVVANGVRDFFNER